MEFNVKEFRKYSQFGNVPTMDKVIYEYMDILKEKRVAKSAIKLLLLLGSRSQMIPGVSWMKQATIAEALGYSDRTIRNAFKTLIEYGMIKQERTTSNWETPTGGDKKRQGVNVIIIQSFISEPVSNNNSGHDFQPIETDEVNEDKPSEGEIKSEPCSYNHSLKQESNIYKAVKEVSTEFIPNEVKNNATFETVTKYMSLKLWEKVKNGYSIDSLGSLCNKFMNHEIMKMLYRVNERIQQRKVVPYQPPTAPPFYNWLDS